MKRKVSPIVKIAVATLAMTLLAGYLVPFIFPRPAYTSYSPYLEEAYVRVVIDLEKDPSTPVRQSLDAAITSMLAQEFGDPRARSNLSISYNSNTGAWRGRDATSRPIILLLSNERNVDGARSGYAAITSAAFKVVLLTDEEARAARVSLELLPRVP